MTIKRGLLTALSLAAFAALLGIFGFSHAAFAAGTTTPPVKEAITGWNYGGIWAGNYRLDNGTFPVYCIKAYADYPSGPYSSAVGVVSSPASYRVAWLIDTYGTSTDPSIQAAIAAEIGLHFDTVDTTEKWNVLTPGQQTLATNLWATAGNNAGPYAIYLSLPAGVPRGVNQTATISVRSAASSPVVGATVSISSSTANLSTASVTTDSSGNASFVYNVPTSSSSGTYSIKVATSLALDLVTYNPLGTGPIRQSVMGGADPTTISDTETADYSTTRPVAMQKIQTGTSLAIPGAVYQLSISGTPLFNVTTQYTPVSLGTLTEGATYTLTELSAPPGYYISPSSSSSSFTVGIGTDTTLVTMYDPAVPNLSIITTARASGTTIGSALADGITVHNNDGEDGTLTGTLYGPVVPTSSCAALTTNQWYASPAQTFTTAFTGNASVNFTGPTASGFGCYSWLATAQLPMSGASTFSPVGLPSETIYISPPAITTSASTIPFVDHATVSDSVTISQLTPATATIVTTLYGPLAPSGQGCAGLNWSAAPSKVVSTLTTNTNQTYSTPAPSVTSLGCYSFGVVLTVGSQQVTSPPGSPGESVLAAVLPPPTISTSAQGVPNYTTDALHDAVTISAAPTFSGTITTTIYGPLSPSSQGCTGLNWSAAAARALPARAISSGQSIDTTSVSVAPGGCYSFANLLTVGAITVSSPPGAPTETLLARILAAPATTSTTTIPNHPTTTRPTTTTTRPTTPTTYPKVSSPRIVTTIHRFYHGRSAQIYDSVTFITPKGYSGLATISLLGPLSPQHNSCGHLTWRTARVAAAFIPQKVTSSTTVHSHITRVTRIGCYSYHIILTGHGSTVAEHAGSPKETTRVLFAKVHHPTTTTTRPRPHPTTTTPQVLAGGGGPPSSPSSPLWPLILVASGILLLALTRRPSSRTKES